MSAQQIHQKYGVARSTAWRASKRGYFWKYHREVDSPPVSKETLQTFERLATHKAVNTNKFESLKNSKIWDVMYGKSTLREIHWNAFKKEWNELRRLLRRFVKAPLKRNLKAISADKRIKQFTLIGNKQAMDRLRRGMNVSDKELLAAKKKVEQFLKETEL